VLDLGHDAVAAKQLSRYLDHATPAPIDDRAYPHLWTLPWRTAGSRPIDSMSRAPGRESTACSDWPHSRGTFDDRDLESAAMQPGREGGAGAALNQCACRHTQLC
jgi:hypothetical protein